MANENDSNGEGDDEGNGGYDDDEDEESADANTIRPVRSLEEGDSDGEATLKSPPALDIPRSSPVSYNNPLLRENGQHSEQGLSSYSTAKTVLSPPTRPELNSYTTARTVLSSRPTLEDRNHSHRSTGTGLLSVDRATERPASSTTSFETASEGSGMGIIIDEPGEGHTTPNVEDDETDGAMTPRPFSGTNSSYHNSMLSPAGASAGAGHASLTSQSPLLRPEFEGIQSDHQPAETEPHVKNHNPVQDQILAETADSEPVVKRPNSSGLVHFAEPTSMPMRQELQMRAKIAHHAQKRISRKFTRGKLKDGEIVKMEKMLVRFDITSGSEQPSEEYDEKDSRRVDTRTVEKWREFMVVCRESHEDDAVLCLEMYKTRVIPATDKSKTKKNSKHEILLTPQKVRVNLYSALDKTVVLWRPKGLQTQICFLRPHSGASAVEWYTFLRSVLGMERARTLQVNIPDFQVSIRVDNPFARFEKAQNMADAAEGDEEAMMRIMKEEQAIAGKIVDKCMDMLAAAGEWNDILPIWAKNGRVGLAWKRYDRLEWVHGANERKMYGTLAMQKTHELELRPKQHYPTSVRPQAVGGETMTEPAPVEGFLIRLTSQKGNEQKLGKLFYKRLYFTTHNNHLLFLKPAKASPPPPPKMPMQDNARIPTAKQIADKIPLIYAVNPYPVYEDNIAWLHPDAGGPASMLHHDQDAYDEAERNVHALLNCDGFINLCDVVKVRKMKEGATPADENLDEGSDVDFDAEVPDSHRDDGTTTEPANDRTFELVMRNGLVVRLQAFSKATKKEWMKRLRALVVYWSIRTTNDMDLFKSVRRQNLAMLGIDERTEAQVGQFAHKWEVVKSFASPELYHMCGISSCRSIHRSGILFRKPRIHKTFTRCYVILCHGHLLIFEDTLRKMTGKKIVHIHHERIACIDLRDCYLYAGLITENDLLYQNRTFDNNMPGNHALPKLYAEDNWTSTDEDAMTCFVIWHSQRKGWFRSNKEPDDVEEDRKRGEREERREEGRMFGGGRGRGALKRVSQLGVPGRSIVFKARSRAERDHWVMGISDEIERLGQGEEVRVVGDD